MKKAYVCLLLVICLLVSAISLGGCGIKEKAAEAIGEKIAEKALGDNVDIDGDQMTIKGDNGEQVTIGGGQWPDSELSRKLPEFKKGKIVSSLVTEEAVNIILEEVKTEDVMPYIEEIKKAYPEDSYESQGNGAATYSGSNKDKFSAAVNFDSEEGTVIITVTKNSQ